MYFTKLRLSGNGTIDLLKVGAATTDAYILKSISGLGPAEADVFISSTVNQGGVFQSRVPHPLEPVVLMGLNPNYTIGQTAADLRTAIYKLSASATGAVTLQLMDGATVVAQVTGYPKKVETVPFDKNPQCQITFACPNSHLEAPADTNVTVPAAGVAAITFTAGGDDKTGFLASYTVTAARTFITITHSQTGQFMKLTYAFAIGDVVTIDTRPGSRKVTVTRSGVTTNIIGSLSTDSKWLTVLPGSNTFTRSANAAGGTDWTSFLYKARFQGV